MNLSNNFAYVLFVKIYVRKRHFLLIPIPYFAFNKFLNKLEQLNEGKANRKNIFTKDEEHYLEYEDVVL